MATKKKAEDKPKFSSTEGVASPEEQLAAHVEALERDLVARQYRLAELEAMGDDVAPRVLESAKSDLEWARENLKNHRSIRPAAKGETRA